MRLSTTGKGGVCGTRLPCARQRRRSQTPPAWQTAASALPSPHSAALEPPSQFRGRQQQDKGTAGSRAPASAAAAAAASAFELATTTSASPAIGRRQRLGSSPPPPPRSPRSPRLSSPQHEHQQHLPAWLGSAVRRAVLSLDEAPLLVVKVSSGEEDFSRDPRSSSWTSTATSSSSPSPPSSPSSEFVTHALPRAALSAPALWPAIAATVVAPEGREPEALLLVHKIEEGGGGADGGGEAARSGSPSPSSSSPRHSHHHLRLSDFAALERGGIATAELAGRVGDCCHGEGGAGAEAEVGEERGGDDGDDEAGFVDGDLRALISPRRSASPSLHSETHWGSSSSSSSSSSADVAFYGVVVQTAKPQQQQRASLSSSPQSSSFDSNADASSSSSSAASGCFVLKTVRTRSSSPGGCSCVYYSLTRVGRAGEPLAEQLKRSWLA